MLVLPTQLTHAQAGACLAVLSEGMRGQSALSVELDGAALEHFDSSALAVVLGLQRAALQAGKTLVVRRLPPRLQDLARLYGLGELLGLRA